MENAASDSNSFATLLKRFRKRCRLTQQQLGEQVGLHRQTIANYECDRLPQNKHLVLDLARALRLSDKEIRELLEASLTAPAPQWVVPYPRNPFFTGREGMLAQLHSLLAAKQQVAVTCWALSGLGGIGKTQLALEYAYRHALDYNAVLWIDAETQESLLSSATAIAKALALPEWQGANQQQLLDSVERWLQAHSGWLLIWDNLEKTELISRFLTIPHGAHLITTRLATTGTLAQHLDLLPLPPEEALLFLLRRTKRLPAHTTSKDLAALAHKKPKAHTAAKALVQLLDGLPLALDQAGAYIEAARCSIGTYLEQYQAQRGYLLAQRGQHQGHPKSVTTTFRLALSRLEPAQTATDLLRLCAFLAPDAIPEDLLAMGKVDLGVHLTALATNVFALDEAFMTLLSLSLIQRQPETGTFSLHRLVQAVQQECLEEDDQRLWAERAVRLVAATFPDSNEFANWGRCQQLLSHALVCAGHIERWNFLFPEAASLLNEVGNYLRQRVQIKEALRLVKQALTIRELTLEPHHPDLATSLNNLAGVYFVSGEPAKALPLYEQALTIREHIFGPQHLEVARALNNIGATYVGLGQHHTAETRLLRALAILEHHLGPDHPHVATILQNLGDVYRQQARYQEAMPRYQQAAEIRKQMLGADHPDYALSLENLAKIYEVERRYEQAIACYRRALTIREQFGSNHPDLALSLHGLASVYHRLGQDDEAVAYHKRALKAREQGLGPEHPDIAMSLWGLADCYTTQGHCDLADELYQQALAVYEQQLGAEHPHTALMLKSIAALRMRQHRWAEARTLYQRVVRMQTKQFGKDHPITLETREHLSQLARERQVAHYLHEQQGPATNYPISH